MNRRPSFLRPSKSVIGIIILCKLARSNIRFTELYHDSNIKMKKSFFAYCKYCLDKKLLEHISVKRSNRKFSRSDMFYHTTDLGHQFLTSLGENN